MCIYYNQKKFVLIKDFTYRYVPIKDVFLGVEQLSLNKTDHPPQKKVILHIPRPLQVKGEANSSVISIY